MLRIENLHATVAGKPILNGLALHVPAGEIHAIMGPNGSGKSTLAYVLGGRPGYDVTEGSVSFDGRDLFALEPHERAAAGMFLGFNIRSNPARVYLQFLRESLNRSGGRGARPTVGPNSSSRQGAGRAARNGFRHAQAAGQCRLLAREKKRAEMVRWGHGPTPGVLDETTAGSTSTR